MSSILKSSLLVLTFASCSSTFAAMFTAGNNGNSGYNGSDFSDDGGTTFPFAGFGGGWGDGYGILGQAFAASANSSLDSGVTTPDTVFLQNVTFFLGPVDSANDGSQNTQLSVYEYTSSGISLLGSSSIIDTFDPDGGATTAHDPVLDTKFTFVFDDVELDYDTTYLYLFEDAVTGDSVRLNLFQGWEPADHVLEVPNGGAVFDGTAWVEDVSADFTATCSTVPTAAVPVPGAAWLFGSALILGGTRRIKRAAQR